MTNETKQKQIFIVDDHPVFREGLVGLVRREPDLTICGEADNAPQALAALERLNPDLVLADISLAGKSGLELIKDIHAVCPQMAVLVISMHDEALYAERVLRAGGRGYIMKQAGPEKILLAIRQVLGGQISVTGQISSRILGGLSDRLTATNSPIARLTDREFEIFQLIGEGRDSHEIAECLNLSSKTVDAHRGRIKDKLELSSGMALICYAARWVATQDLTRT